LAAAASTDDLQSLILSPHNRDLAQNLWLNLHGNDGIALPVDPSDHIQRVWDAPGITKDKAEVLAATTVMDKARLLAISAPHSSDWLFALPVSSCGLRPVMLVLGLGLGP